MYSIGRRIASEVGMPTAFSVSVARSLIVGIDYGANVVADSAHDDSSEENFNHMIIVMPGRHGKPERRNFSYQIALTIPILNILVIKIILIRDVLFLVMPVSLFFLFWQGEDLSCDGGRQTICFFQFSLANSQILFPDDRISHIKPLKNIYLGYNFI
jgi:hypothetical protein